MRCCKKGQWIRNLLHELGIENKQIILFEDNIPCIQIAKEPRQHQRIKHVDIKYMFIRNLVEQNIIDIRYISSSRQIADMMTKQLLLETFASHLHNLGLKGSVELP